MKIEECIKFVDELICTIDDIISRGAIISDTATLDRYRDVSVQMKQLIRTLFSDADKRLKDEDESTDIASKRDGNFSNRTSYLEQAKATKRYLISIKDSLRLRESVKINEDKLEGLRGKVEEKEIEAERREKVTETKFYGAAIEIIDRLRDQLKNEGDIKQEIINIKNELNGIKEVLRDINKKSDSEGSPE